MALIENCSIVMLPSEAALSWPQNRLRRSCVHTARVAIVSIAMLPPEAAPIRVENKLCTNGTRSNLLNCNASIGSRAPSRLGSRPRTSSIRMAKASLPLRRGGRRRKASSTNGPRKTNHLRMARGRHCRPRRQERGRYPCRGVMGRQHNKDDPTGKAKESIIGHVIKGK